MNNKKNRKNSGFTLVETLVAISIFTMSILALLAVLTSSIASTTYAKQKIIASYLAQEGIEYIRNMRDTFVLYNPTNTNTGWIAFNTNLIGHSCQLANGCYFGDLTDADYANQTQPMAGIPVTACSGSNGACPQLLYDTVTGKYGYTSTGNTANSGYIRKVSIQVVDPTETKIFSTVYWSQGSGNYNVNFSESLFNWME